MPRGAAPGPRARAPGFLPTVSPAYEVSFIPHDSKMWPPHLPGVAMVERGLYYMHFSPSSGTYQRCLKDENYLGSHPVPPSATELETQSKKNYYFKTLHRYF